MSCAKFWGDVPGRVRGLVLSLFLLQSFTTQAALEQTFAVLRIGATTYRNVTVTTKNKNYVFLLHSDGMTNIKVSDLTAEERLELGYQAPAEGQASTNSPAAWARQTLTRIEGPQMKRLEGGMADWYRAKLGSKLPPLNRNMLLLICMGAAGLYLFYSYCCLLICAKAGIEPGPLVWLPLVQLFPLLKAARMSPLWFLAWLVPGLNLLAQILWSVKITQARGKSFLVALLLIFPLTCPLALLYLAFSGGHSPRKESRRVELMTLEAA